MDQSINIQHLNDKYLKLLSCDLECFSNISKLKNIMGVYIAYSPEGKILYIGSTNKFNIRFGTDMKHETTHTLVKKLLKDTRYPNRKIAVDYLVNNCKFKIEECENKREAEALEHFAIWSLNPEFNK